MISVLASAVLAVAKITIGWLAGSTSVIADGFESAGDVCTSGVVFTGFLIGRRPADLDHPYGHGRAEAIAGLIVGVLLTVTGVLIAWHSLQEVGAVHDPPAAFGMWPVLVSIAVKGALSNYKFRAARRLQSSSLMADAWNDTIDILSGITALTALGLTLYDPSRFLTADHFGGFAIGLIVVTTGLRVTQQVSVELMDQMPEDAFMRRVNETARSVPGVQNVEKCWARKSGLRFHIDIHVEVDPGMTVRQSHAIAHEVKDAILRQHPNVANVLVHIEPARARQTIGGERSEM